MKLFTWTLLAALPMALLACGPDKPADTSANANTGVELQPSPYVSTARPERDAARDVGATGNLPPARTGNDGGAPQASSSLPPSDIPAPPEGATYTLQCAVFTGPMHTVSATRLKMNLIQRTGSRDWYILHEENQSTLYFGYYKTYDDRTQTLEYARAQADHARVVALADEGGEKLFPQAIFVPISLPDPPAPREWDIMSSPAYWTLQIAVYRDNPQRKQAAVDAVRQFRANHIDAYFHHFPSVSEVYIGAWPKEAIKQEEASSAKTDDPNQQLLVLSRPLANAEHMDIRTPDGHPVKVVMPKIEIQDPTMKAAIEQYPVEYINGVVVGRPERMRDGTKKVVPFPSNLVAIPHPDIVPADVSNPDAGAGMSPGGNTPSGSPGLGGLR